MDETLFFPSPNWFLVSNFAVSKNRWIVYGGPRKSICVLEPTNEEDNIIAGNQSYRAHVAFKAHNDKIVSVNISPEFPVKKNFVSGAADGSVKLWMLEKVNNTYKFKSHHSHDVHLIEKEEIIGLGYSTESIVITVGGYGNIVKWDLSSNVCKTFQKFLSKFKPTSMSCSPHIALNVAVGTKQGVIFVLDLTGEGEIVYKVRSQDDEITNLSWCPQYDVQVKKTLDAFERSSAASRLEEVKDKTNTLAMNQSGVIKQLPQDSFDGSIVQEDDTFDIYKDHEANEFGHKKYEPENIVVKIKDAKPEEINFLEECLKLKEDILRRQREGDPSLQYLVETMDKAHVANSSTVENSTSSKANASGSGTLKNKKKGFESGVQIYKHLLATIGRLGSVRIWSKSGRMVASCAIPHSNKGSRTKSISWPTLLWATPSSLLLVDGKSQLLECNPLKIDCYNKLECRMLHAEHKRGLYALATDAPRVQKVYDCPEYLDFYKLQDWSIYSVSQDRNIVKFSMYKKKTVAIYNTCGGYVYNVQFCPYDAGRMAVGVGDGAIRVWQSSTILEDEKMYPGLLRSHWQKVQGKVLSIAWHPTKENLLAFGTAESRVGLLDTSGTIEKPARVLHPSLNGGVYSLCWGSDMQLFAVGGDRLVMYNALNPDASPRHVEVVADGQALAVGSVTWAPRGLLCGSHKGAVALLHPSLFHTLALAYVYSKMVYMMEWHPLQISNSNNESTYKNLIAVCSSDKNGKITILKVEDDEDGGKKLAVWKILNGHKLSVLQLVWSPHRDELLLSTSSDTTVRVWDVVAGACISVFAKHGVHTLGAAWLALPRLQHCVVSGAGDYCLRLWDYRRHAPQDLEQVTHETSTKHKKIEKKEKKPQQEEAQKTDLDQQVATELDTVRKVSKKYLLPLIHKQMNPCGLDAVKKVYGMFVDSETTPENNDGSDFVNIFGSVKQINEVLDKEMAYLLEADLLEAWITLSIFRGHIHSTMEFASQRDMLCPYLVNMAPCVSFKYWTEVTQLYIAQIDRLIAKGQDEKLTVARHYGGAIYKKVTMLLSIHDVKGAVAVLNEFKLFKEAYILCRIRYMDSIAEDTLKQWAKYSHLCGNMRIAAICYIALGDLSEAATVLANSSDLETLNLSRNLAKMSGRAIFADYVESKAQIITPKPEKVSTEALLEELPSKIEVLMRDVQAKTMSSKPEKDNTGELSKELPSKIEVLMEDVLAQTILSKKDGTELQSEEFSSKKDRTEELSEQLPSLIEVLMKDLQVQTLSSKPEKDSTEELLKELPSKSAVLMKSQTISSKPEKDSTEELSEELPSKIEVLMKDLQAQTISSKPEKDSTEELSEESLSQIKDIQSVNSRTENGDDDDDDIGHDFVTLQYEEIPQNDD
ncbi:unnamed protein product [Arctia plantaginis]|uniref:Gem-associated protein 5 n=1 Tax=Arctia plantaginis TaxID=874455 RepID=A0A8S1BEG3_ARCPL|nr:unnamed protein product [Arctia plantaginis]